MVSYRIGVAVMLLVYGLVFRCGTASAQTPTPAPAPPALYEISSWSAGLGAGYEAVVPEAGSSRGGPTAIAYLARPLVDFALVARGSWNVVDGDVRFSPGIHYRFPVLGEHFAAALNYDFYAVNHVPSPANEWSAGLLWARQLGRTVVLGASASYGLDTHDFRPVVQLTLPLHTGRN
jgi:hypothetical protein